LKIIRSAILNEEERKKTFSEVEILRDLNHPFIIKYIDHFEVAGKLCIV
jgi:serine/threonine protein kinase